MRNEADITVTVDLNKFPRELWTNSNNPFMKVDEHLLQDVENWVSNVVPECTYVELIGKCPSPVLLRIGAVLRDIGCLKLTYVKPGWASIIVWDYTESGQ